VCREIARGWENAGKKDEELVVSRWLGGLLNAGRESLEEVQFSTGYREDPGKS
jgi:hypothetical protein